MDSKTPWDEVADKFNTYKDELYYGAADNIEIVWPVVIDFIKNNIPIPKEGRAMDFGCGTGMFCKELQSLGYKSSGIDVSSEMIKIGQEHLDKNIKLYVGDTEFAKKLAENEGKFDLVTSIMVLQFIEDQKIKDFAEILNNNGYLIIVNHNPLHLEDRGFKDTFTLGHTDTTVPLYPRTTENYDAIFTPLGFKRVLETFATESPEFLNKYNIIRNSPHPKYMILAYQLI